MPSLRSLIGRAQAILAPQRRQTELSEEEENRRVEARSSILDFTTYTKPDYDVQPFHRLITDFIDRVVRGEIKRGMIFAPPRHGKSEIVSRRLPAYYLGRNPTHHIIACSYSSGLASRMNRDVQRIIDSDPYKQLFPGTALYGKNIRTVAHGSWLRNNDLFEVVDHAGSYRAAGVGGGVTGMGASLILLDDYLKNAAEARSETIRDSQWEWFSQDVYTRQAPGCAILIICTRWTHDDIPGRLLKMAEEDGGEQWEVLRLPAIAESKLAHPLDPRQPGEALWPDRFGLEWLERARRQLGPRPFGALYQQNPTPKEGGLFQEDWFKIQEAPPARGRLTHFVRIWDKGYASEGDPSAGTLMARSDDGFFYILDISEVQLTPRQRNQHILNTAHLDREQYGHVPIGLEQPPGAGVETTDTLIRLLAGFPVSVVLPRGAKEERAEPLSDQVEAGNVILIAGPWTRKFISQACQFPGGEHDDMVDSASHAFNYLALRAPHGDHTTSLPNPPPPDEPPGRIPSPKPPDYDRMNEDRRRDEETPRRRYFGR